jgi:predicted Zn finger-like uncharacterized protein
MIAACPKCQTRYRVEPERVGPDGARLRCSQCSAVFRVRAPSEAPAATSSATPLGVATAPPITQATTGAPGPIAPRQSTAPEVPASAGAVGAGARSPSTREASAIQGLGASRSEAQASEAHQARSGVGNDSQGSAEGRFRPDGKSPRRGAEPTPDAPSFDRDRLVLVAHPHADACKRLAEVLEREGLQVLVAHDGVEAILAIQRALPRAVVLDAALPRMFGFQVCELVKRNESLRVIHVCLMGAIHKEDRYRRAPNEIYGADFYLEPPALPGALLDWLLRLGLPLRSRAAEAPIALDGPEEITTAPPEAPVTSPPKQPTRTEVPASAGAEGAGARSASTREASAAQGLGASRSEALASEAHKARGGAGNAVAGSAEGRFSSASTAASPSPAPTAPPEQPAATKHPLGRIAAPADTLVAERAQAERLARIIVSDIVLYNEEKFGAAVRSGSVLETLRDELQEGRALFRERIDPRVRDERDFLADELVRVARGRGMA